MTSKGNSYPLTDENGDLTHLGYVLGVAAMENVPDKQLMAFMQTTPENITAEDLTLAVHIFTIMWSDKGLTATMAEQVANSPIRYEMDTEGTVH